jgi:multiple sugar transport system substrate-binding protein
MRRGLWLWVGIVVALLAGGCSNRQEETSTAPPPPGSSAEAPSGSSGSALTIVWAEWDPAKYLQELADGFTKETGVKVKVEQIPWAQFQDKVFTSLAAKQDTYDIVIGDSQWLGRGSESGHYVELTDWLKQNTDVASFYEPALTAYSEYPKGSGKYWAVPAEADACGFAYRKDLFEDPKEKAAFKQKYGRELAVPKTYQELYDLAEFFNRPSKNLYGCALWLGKKYDGVTMGFQQVMWSWGGSYGDDKSYQVEGILNSPQGVAALEFYTKLAKFVPPGGQDFYFEKCLEAYQNGLVAISANYFAFFPGLTNESTNKYAKQTGFFPAPAGPKGHFISVGGQGMSLSAYSKHADDAKRFMAWFAKEETQRQWAKLGGFTTNKKILQSDEFRKATPFNAAFADSLPHVRDFWAVPEYDQLLQSCQTHWNATVVGSEKPKEAMDAIAKEHTEIFKKAGRIK